MRKLFGTDGIRGVANTEPMTTEMMVKVGRAAAHVFKERKGGRHRIVIGKDTRLSGYMLENALASGICSMGVDIMLVGPLPTPGIAFITSGSEPGYDDYRPDAGAICLAVLRRDGFVSLDAGKEEGFLLTKPFTAAGKKLFVNMTTAKGGSLRVEALDAKDNVLAASDPIQGDHPRGEIQWPQNKPNAWKQQPLRLRFILNNASLYSYWLQ